MNTTEACGTRQTEYSLRETIDFLEGMVARLKDGRVALLDAVLVSDMTSGALHEFSFAINSAPIYPRTVLDLEDTVRRRNRS